MTNSEVLAYCSLAYQQLDNGNYKEIKNRYEYKPYREFCPAEVAGILQKNDRIGLFDQRLRCIHINNTKEAWRKICRRLEPTGVRGDN